MLEQIYMLFSSNKIFGIKIKKDKTGLKGRRDKDFRKFTLCRNVKIVWKYRLKPATALRFSLFAETLAGQDF